MLVTKNVVVWFIKYNLICRYGVPERIITDNGINLSNMMITELCKQFKIHHHNSSPYRSKMNGVVEAANKNEHQEDCTEDDGDIQRLS